MEYALSLSPALYATWSPRLLGLLRIILGFLFLQHGTAKLFGAPHVAMFDGLQLLSVMGAAGVIELVGGSLLLWACSRALSPSSCRARWRPPISWRTRLPASCRS